MISCFLICSNTGVDGGIMDDESILIEISKAEKKAKDIKAKALSEKEELVNEAKRAALKIAGDADKNAKKKADDIIKAAEDRLKADRVKIVTKCTKDFENYKKKATGNIEEAADFAFEKFISKLE